MLELWIIIIFIVNFLTFWNKFKKIVIAIINAYAFDYQVYYNHKSVMRMKLNNTNKWITYTCIFTTYVHVHTNHFAIVYYNIISTTKKKTYETWLFFKSLLAFYESCFVFFFYEKTKCPFLEFQAFPCLPYVKTILREFLKSKKK